MLGRRAAGELLRDVRIGSRPGDGRPIAAGVEREI